MFSGIRYIFGYNDETAATQGRNDDSATTVAEATKDVTASRAPSSVDTSANKLEKTLNAATTKFTEQLLPQQASIEELQTSSHQLLPSIIEQHEEDELKKKGQASKSVEVVDGDDDEDDFNAESWELLDLVEKADDEVAPVGPTSSVQKGDTITQGLCKSTSGILKSQNSCDLNENGNSQRRQKAKVSFEAPELVRSKHEIEQTMSNATAASGPGVVESELVGKVDSKKVPTLNYAKALSKKPATGAVVELTEGISEPRPCSSKTNHAKDAKVSEDFIGPVKRVRPTRVSTSSWSSHDEEDNIEQVDSVDWEGSNERDVKPTMPGVGGADAVAQIDDDDNESIISSGFSDCDYGFGGIGDYVMRPKKTNGKRGRTISGSSSSINRMKSSRPDKKVTNAKAKLSSAMEAKNELKSTDAKDSKSETSRNSKPKKKRMIMTASKSVNLSDFLKNRPGSSKEVAKQNAHKTGSEVSLQVAQKPTVNGGSTESSDIAEMDESWFVTPPPCFTKAVKTDNSNKVDLPETKEDDQENALIEHPSVYIANAAPRGLVKGTSSATAKMKSAGILEVKCVSLKKDPIGEGLVTLEDESWNSGEDEDDANKVAGAEREAGRSTGGNKKCFEAKSSDEMSVLISTASSKARGIKKKTVKFNEKGRAQAKSTTVASKPAESQAWKNKFIVDVWDLDDNDDVDSDFDSMFEPTRKRKSNKTKKSQQKQIKVRELSTRSTEIASFDYSSSSSVELLSVKSLKPSEFEDHENLGPEISLKSAFLQQAVDEPKQTASQFSKGGNEQRRPPTQVRPLEPERVPSWQLKRQRSKRRPLATVSAVNKQQSVVGAPKTSKVKNESSASASSSSRSTPTLIDRIGCSIVANLTNLTSGLVSSGAINYCQSNGQSSMMESQERTVTNKSNFNKSATIAARKQLSRGSIRRQNICAKQGNTLRRPDRRLKIFATPNGCSINRKVHTSIH